MTSKKDELLRVIADVKGGYERLVSLGQKITRDASRGGQMAGFAEEFYANVPEDKYLPDEYWNKTLGFWGDTREGLQDVGMPASSVSLAASTTHATVSDVIFTVPYEKELPEENRRRQETIRHDYTQAISVTSWDEELKGEFVRLGLNQSQAGHRSALEHLSAAKRAVAVPSAGGPAAATVLLPARSAIDEAVNALVQRTPTQKRTPNFSQKVSFILDEAAKQESRPAQTEQLSDRIEALRDRLSEAKQKVLSQTEIHRRLAAAETWLKAFLMAVDDAKLRP